MSLSDSIKSLILAYLYHPISLSDFRASATPLALDAGDSNDEEALRIANELLADLSDLDLGHLSEDKFKRNLGKMYFAFGQSTASKYLRVDFSSDSSTQTLTAQTGTSTTVEEAAIELSGTGRAMVYA